MPPKKKIPCIRARSPGRWPTRGFQKALDVSSPRKWPKRGFIVGQNALDVLDAAIKYMGRPKKVKEAGHRCGDPEIMQQMKPAWYNNEKSVIDEMVPFKELYICHCGEIGHYFHCHFKGWKEYTPFAPESSLKQTGWLLLEAEYILSGSVRLVDSYYREKLLEMEMRLKDERNKGNHLQLSEMDDGNQRVNKVEKEKEKLRKENEKLRNEKAELYEKYQVVMARLRERAAENNVAGIGTSNGSGSIGDGTIANGGVDFLELANGPVENVVINVAENVLHQEEGSGNGEKTDNAVNIAEENGENGGNASEVVENGIENAQPAGGNNGEKSVEKCAGELVDGAGNARVNCIEGSVEAMVANIVENALNPEGERTALNFVTVQKHMKEIWKKISFTSREKTKRELRLEVDTMSQYSDSNDSNMSNYSRRTDQRNKQILIIDHLEMWCEEACQSCTKLKELARDLQYALGLYR